MTTEVICALIAGVAAVLSALAERRARISTKRTEARAQRREKESPACHGADVRHMLAVSDHGQEAGRQHTNGDVEEAMTAADSAKEAYVDFVRDEAAHQFSKV